MDYLQIEDDTARAIILHHLPLLEKSDYRPAGQGPECRAVFDQVSISRSSSASTRAPGRKYSEERPSYVYPDIMVTKEGDDLKVALNDEGCPACGSAAITGSSWPRRLKDNADAYRFLKDKMKKALWFLRSLDQRDQTIYKVARYIVDKQKDFFEKGTRFYPAPDAHGDRPGDRRPRVHGRPGGGQQVYVTPGGVFPLKYFFHKSLAGDFGGRGLLAAGQGEDPQRLVEGEDQAQPAERYGDRARFWPRTTSSIARRTVAKYRKQLEDSAVAYPQAEVPYGGDPMNRSLHGPPDGAHRRHQGALREAPPGARASCWAP